MPDLIQALPKGFPPVLWLLLLLTSPRWQKPSMLCCPLLGFGYGCLVRFVGNTINEEEEKKK